MKKYEFTGETKEYCGYSVFKDGRVFSLKTKKFLKGTKTSNGYNTLCLTVNGKEKVILRHRLICLAFYGEKSIENKVVNHLNGDKQDNRLCNLQPCSHSENIKHSFEHLGRRQHNCVQVLDKKLNKKYPSISEASRNTNVSAAHISKCLSGKRNNINNRWSYV